MTYLSFNLADIIWLHWPTCVLFVDDSASECDYVDLLLNPERYTGYKGSSPHRIWNSIYDENCFK